MKNLVTAICCVSLFFILHSSFFISPASAQTDSTAARIVDRYLDLLNIPALPQDSMLVLTTTVTTVGTTDTVTMTRLFQQPQMFRVEVRNSQGMQTGLCSNGKDRFRHYTYSRTDGWWNELKPADFYNKLVPYDFRGPLYNWRNTGLVLTYTGKVRVGESDNYLDAVRVESEEHYTRIYMFEESGLLSVIVELDEILDTNRVRSNSRIDWKCEHEYSQVGETILPSLESFMRQGRLTVLRTEMHLEQRNNLKFNQD